MTHTENVQNLIDVVGQGKKAADFVITVGSDRRLKAVPASEVANKDVLKLGPEDMKVSATA